MIVCVHTYSVIDNASLDYLFELTVEIDSNVIVNQSYLLYCKEAFIEVNYKFYSYEAGNVQCVLLSNLCDYHFLVLLQHLYF